jgi:poly-gamma-glutamate synthesis protein (capsule biosynthesis protein)
VRQEKVNFKLTLLEGNDKEEVSGRIETYSNIIHDPYELKKNWKAYIEKQSKQYLNYWAPVSFIQNRYIAAIFRRMGVNFFNKKISSLYLKLMRCEAHRDMSKEVLSSY